MKKIYSTLCISICALGAQAQSISPGGIYAAANFSQGNGVGLEWVLGDINAFSALSPLPVKLVRFEGTLTTSGDARLEWETVEEYNNAGFEIHKSTDGQNWNRIGFVDGNGNAKQRNVYEYTDTELSTTSYYRLYQLDFDGKRTPSKIISIIPAHENLDRFTAYPNPARDGKLTISLPDRSSKLTLINAEGKIIQEITQPASERQYQLPARGKYILHLEAIAGSKSLHIVYP